MELDRHFIERNDFSAARRGYDPDEVDRHLREIADSVTELKRAQKRSPSTIASQAAEQVRGIVEAAERSASDIQEQAEEEAKRITDDASARARETRERADSDAVDRVRKAEEATGTMLERANGVESEIDRLLGEMRTAATTLVEHIRTGTGSLETELNLIRKEFESVREDRLEPIPTGGAAAPAAEGNGGEPAVAEPEAVEPEVADAEETAVDAPPVEEEEVEVDEEEPAAEVEEEEVEVEEEATEEAPAAESGGGRSIRGAEGARLIALNMALNGTPRDETARYLSQNFDLDDQDALLDEVYARVGG
ncbi:MAG: DivIVA domain-containing protein [Gaiellaceae bacterium]